MERKLKTIWYIPRPCSPIIFDKKILYINPKPLTIILDIDKIIVANKRFGIFLKNSPPTDNIYSMEVFIMHLKIILYCYILLNKGFILSKVHTYSNPILFR